MRGIVQFTPPPSPQTPLGLNLVGCVQVPGVQGRQEQDAGRALRQVDLFTIIQPDTLSDLHYSQNTDTALGNMQIQPLALCRYSPWQYEDPALANMQIKPLAICRSSPWQYADPALGNMRIQPFAICRSSPWQYAHIALGNMQI